jgi:hypothetical protein
LNRTGIFAELTAVGGYQMIATECPNCGETVSAFASSCARCGAPNELRRRVLGIAVLLLALILLGGIAAVVALHWPPASTRTAGDDFGWLTTAMTACDDDAAKQPSKVYFLVIPLASNPEQDSQWREKSLNDIGNAILLRSDAALEGLKNKSLTISTTQYVFAMRDQGGTVYSWNPTVGVARFVTNDSDSIQSFQVQFRVSASPAESEWGRAFVRQRGNCYWVDAIIGK